VTAPVSDLSELVDSRVGVIKSCVQTDRDPDEPPRPVLFHATLSNFDLRRPHFGERTTSGKGRTDDEAERGAIVEALERYCASIPAPDALVVGSQRDLDGPAIAPAELVLYSGRQYKAAGPQLRRPSRDDELTWVRGRLVGTEEDVFVPATLVYMNFVGERGSELFALPTSNGLAGGQDLSSAVFSGLLELVERDAFLITWLARISAPRIEYAGHDSIASEIRSHYERFGIETLAFDLTTDLGLPVVMALAIDQTGAFPAATVGLGCDLDPSLALDRAVMEVVQVRAGTVPLFRGESPPDAIERYEDVQSLWEHGHFAANPRNLGEFEFLLEGGERRNLTDLASLDRGSVDENLALCVERLEAAESRVAYVDLTTSDIAPFGITIVRTVATGLQPMHFGYAQERLGGRRVFAVPQLLGYASRHLAEDDLNRCPHPLA
jgi:ribosomal protein S12 methylthiotransferase accessory factor